MNGWFVSAGSLLVLAAAIHGGLGEVLVVRRLKTASLPRTPFGGTAMSMAMLRVAWHVGTLAFLLFGSALVVAGTILSGEAATATAAVSAVAATAFAALVVCLGYAHTRSLRGFFAHPAPIVLTVTASLAWIGLP